MMKIRKGKGKQRMAWLLLSIVFILVVIITFFKIPYSMTKNSYQKDVNHYVNKFGLSSDVFREKDIMLLPEPVRNYFHITGYLGKTKMAYMKAFVSSVPLIDSSDKPPMIVDYTLCSFADEPVRLAYIDTSMFGIPFEAYDSTQNSLGFMKGVAGKIITVFNQTGPEMDKGQLLTYLSECFFIPSSLLSEYITWESIDSTHVKAAITYKGISGSGIFTFDENGFVKSFQTDERAKVGVDGSVEYPKWSLIYESFQEKDGVYYPSHVKTIWHESDGDLVYFDGADMDITFDQ